MNRMSQFSTPNLVLVLENSLKEVLKQSTIVFDMRKKLRFLRNKYILTGLIFALYSLFLDENDLFSIVSQKRKLSVLNESKAEMKEKLDDVTFTLKKLRYRSEVERYAREKKFFKKDDEDVFVITYE
jgi:cell division protein DivIC